MKHLKTALLSLILLVFLQFSANSQSISLSKEKICFDSLAAESLALELEVKDTIIKLYSDELEKCSAEKVIIESKLFAKNDTAQYWKGKYFTDLRAERKEKRTWLWSFIGMAAAAFVFGVK